MGEIVSIWLGGAAVLLLVAASAGAVLRFTKVGRAQELTLRELVIVLAVCVGLSCAVYSLLTLAA